MSDVSDREALAKLVANELARSLLAGVADGFDGQVPKSLEELPDNVADELIAAGVLFPHPPDPPQISKPNTLACEVTGEADAHYERLYAQESPGIPPFDMTRARKEAVSRAITGSMRDHE